jgi:hypothetical protein
MPKLAEEGSRLTIEQVCMVIDGKMEEGKITMANGVKGAMA